MRLVIMGPPGSGKGTQATRLAQALGIPHLSTGDLLRAAIASGSELGERVRATVESGSLVPDELITDLVLAELSVKDTGYLLDGYPRSPVQAQALLDGPVPPEHVVVLEVSDDELRRRMLRRAEIEGRQDDNAEVIEHRLKVYADSALPSIALLAEHGLVVRIDAERDPEEVAEAILSGIRERADAG